MNTNEAEKYIDKLAPRYQDIGPIHFNSAM